MTNLEWCHLVERFYEFKIVADPLGFYGPELADMEENLMKCRPFEENASAMESVLDLVGKADGNCHTEAVKIVRADETGLYTDSNAPVDWLDGAMKVGAVYYNKSSRRPGWFADRTLPDGSKFKSRIQAGDYILFDVNDASLHVASGSEDVVAKRLLKKVA